MKKNPPLIDVHDLTVLFRKPPAHSPRGLKYIKTALLGGARGSRSFKALKDVSIRVNKGETLGVIGENGSGKSTLLKIIGGILNPDHGEVRVRGSVAPFLELGSGFEGELSARENVFLYGALLGIAKSQMARRFNKIISFAGLENFVTTPVKNFSSGMYARLAFSCATSVEADLILIDEVFAVGDEAFRQKCIQRLTALKKKGVTIVLVSHRLGDIVGLCDRLVLLHGGSIIKDGPPRDVVDYYLNNFVSQAPLGCSDSPVDIKPPAPGTTQGENRGMSVVLHSVKASPRELRTGDGLSITIHFKTSGIVKKPYFCVQIFTQGGSLVYGTNTLRDSIETGDIVANRSGKITLEIPELLLLQGRYKISAQIFGGENVAMLHSHPDAEEIEVLSTKALGTGVALLKHSWKDMEMV